MKQVWFKHNIGEIVRLKLGNAEGETIEGQVVSITISGNNQVCYEVQFYVEEEGFHIKPCYDFELEEVGLKTEPTDFIFPEK